jgi:xanthine dehydrogenase YagS FAD-binding subunit
VNSFAIAQARSYQEASQLLLDKGGGKFTLPIIKAGGMDVLDHLKEGLIEPDLLVNIKRIRQDPRSGSIFLSGGVDRDTELTIDATTTLTEIVESGLLRRHAPVVSQSLESAASPQVRNVGTAAGNLLQRPRCWYYRNDQFDCLKKGGATCYAVHGENQYHAIFGDGPCHIVHPSNLAPALLVCDAVVHVVGGKRESLPCADLFHMPDRGVRTEHNLEPGEVLTHITLKPRPKSGFYSIKEKQSFDWPVAMCAAALEMTGDIIQSARICAGAVAPTPWPLPHVEQALRGVNVTDEAAIRKACDGASNGAKPMSQNAYKLKLLPVAVRRAVLRAAGRLNETEMEV